MSNKRNKNNNTQILRMHDIEVILIHPKVKGDIISLIASLKELDFYVELLNEKVGIRSLMESILKKWHLKIDQIAILTMDYDELLLAKELGLGYRIYIPSNEDDYKVLKEAHILINTCEQLVFSK
ncbi:hypothetical protein [Vallitalea okinawensis]|uniref:hypothetical protein n=1 Tax=Vallitalea okinawensis TaxID=2078660 RepID=UPI000CFCA0D0|nr:hypothetical protein [Vallitalea okinawensis]